MGFCCSLWRKLVNYEWWPKLRILSNSTKFYGDRPLLVACNFWPQCPLPLCCSIYCLGAVTSTNFWQLKICVELMFSCGYLLVKFEICYLWCHFFIKCRDFSVATPNIVYIVLFVKYFDILETNGSLGPVFSVVSDCWICTHWAWVVCTTLFSDLRNQPIAVHIQWWFGLRSRV